MVVFFAGAFLTFLDAFGLDAVRLVAVVLRLLDALGLAGFPVADFVEDPDLASSTRTTNTGKSGRLYSSPTSRPLTYPSSRAMLLFTQGRSISSLFRSSAVPMSVLNLSSQSLS